MQFEDIPLCYFPTMVLLVDDNQSFLEGISYVLDEKIAFQSYDKPYQALEFLKETHQPRFINNDWLLKIEQGQTIDIAGKLNGGIPDISRELYKNNRFNEVSVVLVDYAMPSINGLDFCKNIKDLPIKKILITGEADDNVAIDAFNQGIIGQFIRKNTPDFSQKINIIIFNFQENYFRDISKSFAQWLKSEEECPLYDPAFVKLFKDICNKLKIIEFYLLEKTGSFLLLDIDAKPTWFIVKTEEYLDRLQKDLISDEKYSFVVNKFGSNALIPFFGMSDNSAMPLNWQDYLYPSQRLKGKQVYYYALIDDVKVNALDSDKIISYRNYLGL
jgi:CheY-like chemotaxis protein